MDGLCFIRLFFPFYTVKHSGCFVISSTEACPYYKRCSPTSIYLTQGWSHVCECLASTHFFSTKIEYITIYCLAITWQMMNLMNKHIWHSYLPFNCSFTVHFNEIVSQWSNTRKILFFPWFWSCKVILHYQVFSYHVSPTAWFLQRLTLNSPKTSSLKRFHIYNRMWGKCHCPLWIKVYY